MTEPAAESEAELVRRCAAGESAAWDRFVGRYAALLAALARRMLARRLDRPAEADVDEVVAEVLLALLRRDRVLLRRYDPAFRVSTYLGVICRSEVGRLFRRRARRRAAESRQEAPRTAASPSDAPLERLLASERAEAAQRVRGALATLKPRDRTLLELRYLEGLDYRAIGALCQLNPESVGQLLHRAKARLAEILGDVRLLFDDGPDPRRP